MLGWVVIGKVLGGQSFGIQRERKQQNGKAPKLTENDHVKVLCLEGLSTVTGHYNPAFQGSATRGMKSGRHVTGGACATNTAGEAFPPCCYMVYLITKSTENILRGLKSY